MPHFTWNGHHLFYRERGEGPLLLVLPGNTASSACHEGELDHFSQHHHVASLDFVGTGRSDRVAVWADDWWEDGARQAAALVSHLGRSDCVVVGTSGGAVIALLMAIAFPARVRAVIADSFEERFTAEMLHRNVIADRARRTPGQISFWQRAHGPDWEQVVDADTEMLRRCATSGGDWFGGRLPQIRCPVLLTASKGDALLPDVALQLGRMAGQIPDCRAFLNNAGEHPFMWSHPQDFRTIADYFLSVVKEGEAGARD
jgi:valacyclovir hydrolase